MQLINITIEIMQILFKHRCRRIVDFENMVKFYPRSFRQQIPKVVGSFLNIKSSIYFCILIQKYYVCFTDPYTLL